MKVAGWRFRQKTPKTLLSEPWFSDSLLVGGQGLQDEQD
jgi:hypothetical protein